jgi:hypothetical protein
MDTLYKRLFIYQYINLINNASYLICKGINYNQYWIIGILLLTDIKYFGATQRICVLAHDR